MTFFTSLGHQGSVTVYADAAAQKLLAEHNFPLKDGRVAVTSVVFKDGKVALYKAGQHHGTPAGVNRTFSSPRGASPYAVAPLGYTHQHGLNGGLMPWAREAVDIREVQSNGILLAAPTQLVPPKLTVKKTPKTSGLRLLMDMGDGSTAVVHGMSNARALTLLSDLKSEGLDVGIEETTAA